MRSYPLAANEKERLAALYEYDILDSSIEADFDRVAELASLICGMPISLVTLIDKERQWFKAKIGLDVSETSREHAFCNYAIVSDELMEVPDARVDDRFKANPFVTEAPHVRYYAGYPLIDPKGFSLGTLCVIDKVPRQLTDQQKRALELLRDETVSLIVERKKRDAYKENELKLKIFFENSQGLMCTHDLDGNLLSVNDAGAAILGYSKAEMEKLSLFDIIPAVRHDRLIAYLQDIRINGKARGEMHTLTRTGEPRIWMFNNILQENGAKAAYVIGNAVDITDKYYLELDLKEAQGLLEMTNRVARIGGWEYDVIKERILWTAITKHIHEVADDYQPSLEQGLSFYKDGVSRRKIESAVALAIESGTAWDLELEIRTQRGNELWVRAIGNAEFEGGSCKRLYGTFQDIDKRKRIEIEFSNSKKLLDDVLNAASAVSIIATDTQGLITVFNSGAERQLGYQSEEMVGIMTPEVLHQAEEVEARARELQYELGYPIEGFRVFVEKPERFGSEQREWTYVKKNGEMLTVSLAVTAIRDVNDLTIGFLCVATDITTLVQQREQFHKAKQLAEQASVAKSEFLANMSHEIRTPLNGIIGFTDLVLKTELDARQQQYLFMANQSANVLLSIINDILDFSKIEAGKLELDIEKCDLYEILAQVTDIVNFQMQSKGLDFLINLDADTPCFVWVDSIRLKQVLINLLSNACKFTEAGEIELRVEVLASDMDKSILRFGVRDTGIGIKAEKRDKIFEAFSQEDASTTKRYGGTGLGLTISNKLLHMMGSSLHLESSYGKGSLFYFELSLDSALGDAVERDHLVTTLSHLHQKKDEASLWEEPSAALWTDEQLTVLVVEDNKFNMILTTTILRNIRADVHILEAYDGLEALSLYKEYRPDLIFMDVQMPEMNGYEVTEAIRSLEVEGDNTPIIALTAANVMGEKERCMASGMNDFVVKPVTENIVSQLLEKWLI